MTPDGRPTPGPVVVTVGLLALLVGVAWVAGWLS